MHRDLMVSPSRAGDSVLATKRALPYWQAPNSTTTFHTPNKWGHIKVIAIPPLEPTSTIAHRPATIGESGKQSTLFGPCRPGRSFATPLGTLHFI